MDNLVIVRYLSLGDIVHVIGGFSPKKNVAELIKRGAKCKKNILTENKTVSISSEKAKKLGFEIPDSNLDVKIDYGLISYFTDFNAIIITRVTV